MSACDSNDLCENTCVELGGGSTWNTSIINDLSHVNDGKVWMPIWGMGTSYQQEAPMDKRTKPYFSSLTALQEGYRLFDTASR